MGKQQEEFPRPDEVLLALIIVGLAVLVGLAAAIGIVAWLLGRM